MARNKAHSSGTRLSILVLRNEGYSMREIAKKLKISLHRTAQTVSNQIRKRSERSGRSQCTTEQEDKFIRVSRLRNRRLTSPPLAASLNNSHKTVSTSTVMRRLQDAGLLEQ